MNSTFWIATVVPCTTKRSYNCCGTNWRMQNWQCLWPQSKSIISETAKNTPIFCKKFPPRFQLAKHHRSQRLGYRNSRREKTINRIYQSALQKENIFLTVHSTTDPILISSGWVQYLPHTTVIFVQAGKRGKASRNQTTTRNVGNKNGYFLNSTPKSQNWSQPSNDWFPSSQAQTIM